MLLVGVETAREFADDNQIGERIYNGFIPRKPTIVHSDAEKYFADFIGALKMANPWKAVNIQEVTAVKRSRGPFNFSGYAKSVVWRPLCDNMDGAYIAIVQRLGGIR